MRKGERLSRFATGSREGCLENRSLSGEFGLQKGPWVIFNSSTTGELLMIAFEPVWLIVYVNGMSIMLNLASTLWTLLCLCNPSTNLDLDTFLRLKCSQPFERSFTCFERPFHKTSLFQSPLVKVLFVMNSNN